MYMLVKAALGRKAAAASLLIPSCALALTRSCHYQYHMAYIAIKGGRGDIIYRAIVWAMRGGEGGAQRKGLLANKRIESCTKALTG